MVNLERTAGDTWIRLAQNRTGMAQKEDMCRVSGWNMVVNDGHNLEF